MCPRVGRREALQDIVFYFLIRCLDRKNNINWKGGGFQKYEEEFVGFVINFLLNLQLFR